MTFLRALALALLLVSCTRSAAEPVQPSAPAEEGPLAITYLGVAGWQLSSGESTILVDPYLSRPNFDAPIVPDADAIARYAPARARLILIGHSHVDHVLDAPSIALRSGAEILGSDSTTRFALASGVPADHLITVKGGEDFAFGGFSVRVIPSLHAALDNKHTFGRGLTTQPTLPMKSSEYEEGGTFIYLVRIAGRQVLVSGTANFIERELEGLRPDIAIIAPGLRHEIHDYTCRLLRTLGYPPLVYPTHFDDWRAPPPAAPSLTEDVRAFAAEVAACSPQTRLVVPRHFEPMVQ